jgi:molecular chaperone Hsp33
LSILAELHRFLFDGMPVRGALVRLTDAWVELQHRHAGADGQRAYAAPVRDLLGQMSAAAVLMQSAIRFEGSLVLQVQGDGPVKLAVVEVTSDFTFRGTATVRGDIQPDMPLSAMVNVHNQGRCAITLDPKGRAPGVQPYQGVVPLFGDHGEKLERISDVLAHYMLQSEQLDTVLVLASNADMAAGLMLQRLPLEGQGNLQGQAARAREDDIGLDESFNRLAHLANSLTQAELLGLDADTVLRRLFWQEPLQRFEPQLAERGPRFACTCSRARVARMIQSLGADDVQALLAERGQVEVGCEFCGVQYHFDPVDATALFSTASVQPPSSGTLQ